MLSAIGSTAPVTTINTGTVGSPSPPLLCNFIQFGGHTSRTPCAAMNFGLGHGSRQPVPNVKCVTPGTNLPRRCKKGRIFENFRLVCRIFGSVAPNFVGCRSAESVFWVKGHNPCRIERNCAVHQHPYQILPFRGIAYLSCAAVVTSLFRRSAPCRVMIDTYLPMYQS
jgi:hypothetical protein